MQIEALYEGKASIFSGISTACCFCSNGIFVASTRCARMLEHCSCNAAKSEHKPTLPSFPDISQYMFCVYAQVTGFAMRGLRASS